jgi:hypothetical protein
MNFTITSYLGPSRVWGMTMEELVNWLKEFFLKFTLENYCREKALVQYQSPGVDKRNDIKFKVRPFQ